MSCKAFLVSAAGFEPATSSLEGLRSGPVELRGQSLTSAHRYISMQNHANGTASSADHAHAGNARQPREDRCEPGHTEDIRPIAICCGGRKNVETVIWD